MSIPVSDDDNQTPSNNDYDSINEQTFAWDSLQFSKLSAEEIDRLVPNEFVIETSGAPSTTMTPELSIPATITPEILEAAQQRLPHYDHPNRANLHPHPNLHMYPPMNPIQYHQQLEHMQHMSHYIHPPQGFPRPPPPQYPRMQQPKEGIPKAQKKESSSSSSSQSMSSTPMCMVIDEIRLNGNHTPCVTPKDPYSRSDMRGHCVSCDDKSKTTTRCVECNIFLHIKGDGQENCWYRFHTMKNHYRKVTKT